MSHHSSFPEGFNDFNPEQTKQSIYDHLFQPPSTPLSERLGATRKFPDGKINEKDEGEIRFACTIAENKLILNFGEKPIAWIGLTKQEAIDLGIYLIQKAAEIK